MDSLCSDTDDNCPGSRHLPVKLNIIQKTSINDIFNAQRTGDLR